jgi:hypothetical protein
MENVFIRKLDRMGLRIIWLLELAWTQNFWANSAIFLKRLLAYNLMVFLMWLNTETRFSRNQTLLELGL